MKASLIIPAHNEENYLGRTLKTARHPDVEVLVVCNGCTDRTAEIARTFPVKVYHLAHRSVSKARNLGAKHARGDLLIFLDADVRLGKDVLQTILDSDAQAGTCFAKPDVRTAKAWALMAVKNKVLRFGFSTGLFFCDRSLFERSGGFDETLSKGEDGKLLRKIKRQARFQVVDAYVINSMRRFEKRGYLPQAWFWLRESLFPSSREYEVVR